MTPEQCARSIVVCNPYTCIACGASLPNEDCGHKKNGVPNACLPAIDNLEADIAQAIREAEASALRRAAEVALDYLITINGADALETRDAILALIPSSPSAESDNGT